MRKLTAATVLCVIIAGCGSGSDKHPATTRTVASDTTTTTTAYHLPATFNAGYEQAWGEMKQVGAGVRTVISQVRRAQAHHSTVPDATLASEFAIFASHFEPALIEFQGLTPPASVAHAYKSMAAAATGIEGSLKNLSTDANANHTSLAARDLADYIAYAMTVDKAALTMYNKLGLK
jgi:hypothetical protein